MQTKAYAHTPAIRALRWFGLLGTVMATIVLGASIVLRQTSRIELDGTLVSLLPPAIENAARLVHRLAASVAGLMALLCGVAGFKLRASHPWLRWPIGIIIGMTVVLAVVGPLTPGYRYDWVTVCNVVAGTVLVGAYGWLWPLVDAPAAGLKQNSWMRWTLVVWLFHIAFGAAASAQIMHGGNWIAFVHSGSAMLAALMLASALRDNWVAHHRRDLCRLLGGLLLVQMGLGTVALWSGTPPAVLGIVHAMLSVALVLGMVNLAAVQAGEVT